MFTRMPNFRLFECNASFAGLEVVMGPEKREEHEGNRTHLKYTFNNQENTIKPPSWLQIRKNYENAMVKIGGKKAHNVEAFATYKLVKDGKETWVQLQMASGDDLSVDEFWLDILEKAPMKQEVAASAMFPEISEKGFIALYINFETGKATINLNRCLLLTKWYKCLRKLPILK